MEMEDHESGYENDVRPPTWSLTFSHRTATRYTVNEDMQGWQPQNDFLGLMTCATDLYSQEGVLQMRDFVKDSDSAAKRDLPASASGAISSVEPIKASFSRPSESSSYHYEIKTKRAIVKRYPGPLFNANGKPCDKAVAASFLTELRVLTHPGLRSAEQVVTMLGLLWDYTTVSSVALFPPHFHLAVLSRNTANS
jgi:hypothetical protein